MLFRSTFSFRAQPNFVILHQFGRGRSIVQFEQVHILRTQTGIFVSFPRG